MELIRVDIEKTQEENPNSRFRVTNVAKLTPGVCFVCGSDGNDERQFVDFGKTVDFYGVVYVCTYCLTEVATIIGLRSTIDAESHILGLQDSQRDHVAQIAELRKEISAARVLLRNCHCSDSDSVSFAPDSVPMDGESTPEAESGLDDGDESGGVEGFDGVSESSNDVDESESAKPVRRSRKSNE